MSLSCLNKTCNVVHFPAIALLLPETRKLLIIYQQPVNFACSQKVGVCTVVSFSPIKRKQNYHAHNYIVVQYTRSLTSIIFLMITVISYIARGNEMQPYNHFLVVCGVRELRVDVIVKF